MYFYKLVKLKVLLLMILEYKNINGSEINKEKILFTMTAEEIDNITKILKKLKKSKYNYFGL